MPNVLSLPCIFCTLGIDGMHYHLYTSCHFTRSLNSDHAQGSLVLQAQFHIALYALITKNWKPHSMACIIQLLIKTS